MLGEDGWRIPAADRHYFEPGGDLQFDHAAAQHRRMIPLESYLAIAGWITTVWGDPITDYLQIRDSMTQPWILGLTGGPYRRRQKSAAAGAFHFPRRHTWWTPTIPPLWVNWRSQERSALAKIVNRRRRISTAHDGRLDRAALRESGSSKRRGERRCGLVLPSDRLEIVSTWQGRIAMPNSGLAAAGRSRQMTHRDAGGGTPRLSAP